MSTTREILFVGRKLLDDAIIAESIVQGHYLTGNFQRSFTAQVTEDAEFTVVASEVASYGVILSGGVPANRVPFGGGGGKVSKYIEGLINYWKLRGLPEKEATRAAFATAKKHKKEGISTFASRTFSQTGQRQGFIQIGYNKAIVKANQQVLAGFNREVQKTFNKIKSGTI